MAHAFYSRRTATLREFSSNMSKDRFTHIIAPNGARIKVKNFAVWSQEIRVRLVFKKSVPIKLDKSPFKESHADSTAPVRT